MSKLWKQFWHWISRKKPTPVEPVVEDMEIDGMRYDPAGTIIIPANLEHAKATLFTLSTHHEISHPHFVRLLGNGDYEYSVGMSGRELAERASKICPKGYPSVMIYINTYAMQATGHRSAGWRLLDPSLPLRGDKTNRLQKGENK